MKRSGLARRAVSIAALALAPLFSPDAQATAIRPDALILLDVTRADGALVAVGERGTVLRSEDGGTAWAAESTAVTRTLTGVVFPTPQVGIAVGHGGVLIRSEDGGRSWKRVSLPDLDGQSLLGVCAVSASRIVAFGSFGLFLQSDDGGLTWAKRQIVGPDFDRHLYGMAVLSPDRWLLVGESGTLALTDNAGANWRLLPSPYEGSFFGVVKTRDNAVIVYGMRGNVFRSADGAGGWSKVETGTTIAFNGGRVLADGRVILVGNGGLVAISADDGKSFRASSLARAVSLATAVEGKAGDLVLAGESGISHLHLASTVGKEGGRE